jgi:protease I
MWNLTGKRIAILAARGFEESELVEPRSKLAAAGATVHVISLKHGEIRGWKAGNWSAHVSPDKTIDEVTVDDYDALVIPGGQINPDLLRADPRAVAFVRAFAQSGKPVGAICHGPWLLIEAGLVRGRRATSYHSIRTDMKNAGAEWIDEAAVVDGNLITSRRPDDLPVFIDTVAELVATAPEQRKAK